MSSRSVCLGKPQSCSVSLVSSVFCSRHPSCHSCHAARSVVCSRCSAIACWWCGAAGACVPRRAGLGSRVLSGEQHVEIALWLQGHLMVLGVSIWGVCAGLVVSSVAEVVIVTWLPRASAAVLGHTHPSPHSQAAFPPTVSATPPRGPAVLRSQPRPLLWPACLCPLAACSQPILDRKTPLTLMLPCAVTQLLPPVAFR